MNETMWRPGQILGVYKPKGPTSFDIIRKIKRISGIKRVGHAGTLDPLASGVLVVGIGREATKRLHEIVGREKEYIVSIKLGETSTTDDEEGKKTVINPAAIPSYTQVEQAVEKFIGVIEQTPPQFSAVKIAGHPAYKSARRGMKLDLKPRRIEIKKIEILNYNYPLLKLRVITGKGVYIRSLARDIGKILATGGYVAELKRIRVGEFRVSDTIEKPARDFASGLF